MIIFEILITALIVLGAVYFFIKNIRKKSKGGSCSCGCDSCKSSISCYKKAHAKQDNKK